MEIFIGRGLTFVSTAHRTKHIITHCNTGPLILCGVTIPPHRDRTKPHGFYFRNIQLYRRVVCVRCPCGHKTPPHFTSSSQTESYITFVRCAVFFINLELGKSLLFFYLDVFSHMIANLSQEEFHTMGVFMVDDVNKLRQLLAYLRYLTGCIRIEEDFL